MFLSFSWPPHFNLPSLTGLKFTWRNIFNFPRFCDDTQHNPDMKNSKMYMHQNVCVRQMSVIFILKIKHYFSSNKADLTNYMLHTWIMLKYSLTIFCELFHHSINIANVQTYISNNRYTLTNNDLMFYFLSLSIEKTQGFLYFTKYYLSCFYVWRRTALFKVAKTHGTSGPRHLVAIIYYKLLWQD